MSVWMLRALECVSEASHRVSPNPKVGCVILDSAGQVVGEGVTQPPGQAHAEVVALNQAGPAARGGHLFVTLEPCCHRGRTAPCTGAIIDAGIAKVSVGVVDPNPLVSGRGIEQLRAAGIEVEVGVEGAAASESIAAFAKFMAVKRPWVMLKAAVTLDGRIATDSGHSKWITGPEARADVHRLRAAADAILVGTGTARADDPRLTVRECPGEDPIAVVLDRALSLPTTLAAFRPGTIVVHGPGAPEAARQVRRDLGLELVCVPEDEGQLSLTALLDVLGQRDILSLMVEGGGRLHGAFLRDRLADEACFYVAPKFIGRGRPVIDLPSAPRVDLGWQLHPSQIQQLGVDTRIRGPIRYPAAP